VADDKDVAQVDDTIQERKIRMPRRFRPKKWWEYSGWTVLCVRLDDPLCVEQIGVCIL
jgi:hypothetical protein